MHWIAWPCPQPVEPRPPSAHAPGVAGAEPSLHAHALPGGAPAAATTWQTVQGAEAWWALRFTPRVALVDEALLLEVSTTERLWGGRAALLAMVVNLGAYSTEIVRAGIQVTPKGQWEAGRVLGLSRTQTFIRVVLPPALQRIYPALVSQCIIVMLGSSVVSQVSYEELTFAANLIQSRTFLSFEVYLVTTGIYLVLSITLRQLLMAAGRKWLGVQA